MAVENPCKIVCFGDSLTCGYTPVFEVAFRKKYPEINATIINAGVSGETSREALRRLPAVASGGGDIAIIGFGMNDQGKPTPRSVSTTEFEGNLVKIIEFFEKKGMRVLLLTINPVSGSPADPKNKSIDSYNQAVRHVQRKTKVRLIDIHAAWRREITPYEKGLEDSLHPNQLGRELYARTIMQHINRKNIIILWQYNGNPCQCNYSCPYCQYETRTQKGHYFQGPIERWAEAFKKKFGNRNLAFYLAHGEPMLGRNWFDVVDMVGAEPKWEMRCTSNISASLTRLLNSKVAREGRLNINASFHPTEISREKFLKKILQCREHGIEVPVIYTMYPPFFARIDEDFAEFSKHKVLLHVRRFRGEYEGKWYPEAYSDRQMQTLAKYCDDATIKYMLSNEPTDGKLSWTGVDFCMIDKDGNVGYCDDYRSDRYSFGNLFDDEIRLFAEPKPFPRAFVSDGTVDGVANIVELNYEQLSGNNVLHFSAMGGVYQTDTGVHYKNFHTDFNDSMIRAQYHFPARNLKDAVAILKNSEDRLGKRCWRIAQSVFPETFHHARPFEGKRFIDELRGLVRRRISGKIG